MGNEHAVVSTVNARQTIDPSRYRKALSRFPSGVTIVTVLDDAGALAGLTANAFTSVSLNPPMVLLCVDYAASAYRTLVSMEQFAIHVLKAEQAELAKRFATEGAARTELCDWRLTENGNPILSDYLVALECDLAHHYQGGDHAILVSEVKCIDVNDDVADPLIFYDGSLRPLR